MWRRDASVMRRHKSIDHDERRRPVTGGRVGPPTAGVTGSMYDFVRRYLVEHGGSCTRQVLLKAFEDDLAMKERLVHSRGFKALLHNMRHSGDLSLDGDHIGITPRALRRLGSDLK